MAPPEIKRSRTRNLQLATRNAFSKGEAPHGNSEKDERLIALFFLLLMIHTILPIQVFAQDDPPPTETVPGDDIGAGDPPVEGPGDGDTAEPPMTDAPGAGAGGSGDEPGEFSTVAATAPEIAGMSGAAAYSIPILVQRDRPQSPAHLQQQPPQRPGRGRLVNRYGLHSKKYQKRPGLYRQGLRGDHKRRHLGAGGQER
jgi:hypothetical protein